MFEATKKAIEVRKQQTVLEIESVGNELGTLSKDGDLFDEVLMRQLLNKREQLHGRLTILKNHLSLNPVILSREEFVRDRVAMGSEVDIHLEYCDNSTEVLKITMGTPMDVEFLSDHPNFDGDTRLIISNASPLGKSILGSKVDDQVKYKAGDCENRARIKNISMSSLLE